jgi:hypothetical protein
VVNLYLCGVSCLACPREVAAMQMQLFQLKLIDDISESIHEYPIYPTIVLVTSSMSIGVVMYHASHHYHRRTCTLT